MEGKVYTFNLPDIGEGVVEGEIVQWLKREGDPVKQDEPVVVVMTDKATVELPAPYPGILLKQYYRAGEVAIKDKPLYDLRLETEIAPPKAETLLTPSAPPPSPKKIRITSSDHQNVQAIPKVRHLAHELGVDMSALKGSGPQGRITEKDLKIPPQQEATYITHLEGDQDQPLLGIRGLMAKKNGPCQSTPCTVFIFRTSRCHTTDPTQTKL